MYQFRSAPDTLLRNDLCPNIGADQSGQLTIIPFKDLPKYVEAGDVVSFIYTNAKPAWDQTDVTTMVKQRGWHAEIVAPKQGNLVLHGPWGQLGIPDLEGKVVETPVKDVTLHPYYQRCQGDWHLHVFRFSPPNEQDKSRYGALLKGLEAWSAIFPRTTWPSDMVFNPILFSDVSSLCAQVGDVLVQKKTPPPTMFCIEWVHAVFSLACCYPLTQKFLSDRGMLQDFTTKFSNIPLLDDSLEPFDFLPWAPYRSEYIIEAFLDTYFAEDLSDEVVDAMPDAAHLRSPVIMPIVPLLEKRKKSNPLNFNVIYVCTAVADEWCVPNDQQPK